MILKRHAIVILTLVFFGIAAQNVAAQIAANPVLPKADSEVAVCFDAAGAAIEDYPGALYTHTGNNGEKLSEGLYIFTKLF